MKNRKKGKTTQESNDDIIARFVISGNGKKVGESVAFYKDLLIVKNEENFLGIPMKHIEFEGTRIIVKGLIDNGKAVELGEEWRQLMYKEIPEKQEES
jgi:hypothetical protein